ncbi:MAG: hypothetical protein BMS9Abin37_2607 [Acidobacteriota bacterium]|nr:MAG: hypothetical protein BMS9Abin37_2607 [Acidobacteriota bacterium]
MKKAQWWLPMLAVIMLLPGLCAAGNGKTIVGKKGTMHLTTETRVGDLVLEPGRYQFQHHVEGSEHYIEFTGVTKYTDRKIKGVGGRARCRLEPLSAKASSTAVSSAKQDGIVRITRVRVSGENVAHVF